MDGNASRYARILRRRPIKRYAIRHPTRGVFVGFEPHHLTGETVPKFMWSIFLYNDPRICFFSTDEHARQALDIINKHISGCVVLPLKC